MGMVMLRRCSDVVGSRTVDHGVGGSGKGLGGK